MFTIWPKEWDGFKEGRWSTTSVNVRDFIKKNYTPYDGDESFLAPPTEATNKLWAQVISTRIWKRSLVSRQISLSSVLSSLSEE